MVPEITGHPQDKKDVCQSEVSVFTVQATGSEPLQVLNVGKPTCKPCEKFI